MKIKWIHTILFFVCVSSMKSQTILQPTGNVVNNTVSNCVGQYRDNGNAANYNNNQLSSLTIYPSAPGQFVAVTFTSFDTQISIDVLSIYDGPGGALLAALSGTPVLPMSFQAANANGALTFVFSSNGSQTRSGWIADIFCSLTPGTPPSFNNSLQDCQQGGGTSVCSNGNFSGNSNGNGSVNDLPNAVNGCLTAEHQSSWYYFSPSSGGTIEFIISPINPADDYDFAVYGPFATVSCPTNVLVNPLRCSYAAGGGNTGLQAGAGDNSEGAGGNRFVESINAMPNEIFVLVIDNYSSSFQPFDLVWNLSGGASLDCNVLPIELISFDGKMNDDKDAELNWITASETNNDFFTIERLNKDHLFVPIGMVDGAGTSSASLYYSFKDENPIEGENYYRLKQTDFNGEYSYSDVIRISNDVGFGIEIYPNPVSDILTIRMDDKNDTDFILELFDATGRSIQKLSVNPEDERFIKMTFSDLDNGIYLLKISDDNQEINKISRVVKN